MDVNQSMEDHSQPSYKRHAS